MNRFKMNKTKQNKGKQGVGGGEGGGAEFLMGLFMKLAAVSKSMR